LAARISFVWDSLGTVAEKRQYWSINQIDYEFVVDDCFELSVVVLLWEQGIKADYELALVNDVL
jgi:hypothetical protein